MTDAQMMNARPAGLVSKFGSRSQQERVPVPWEFMSQVGSTHRTEKDFMGCIGKV